MNDKNPTGEPSEPIPSELGDSGLSGSEPYEEGLPVDEQGVSQEETFYDVDKVPPGLKATFREMQGALTRKGQELAARSKSLGSLEYKADLYDQLTSHPLIQNTLQKIAGGAGEGGQDTGPEDASELVDDSVKAYVDSRIGQIAQYLQQAETKSAVRTEREAFVQNHPNWEQHKEGMAAAWRQDPTLTMEAAFRWAVFDDSQRQQKAGMRRQEAAQNTVERGGAAMPQQNPPKIRSFEDAAQAALRELGMNRKDMTR